MNSTLSHLRVVKSATDVLNYNAILNNNINFNNTTVDSEMDWYALFRTSITEVIDEKPYREMFEQFQSNPSTSVRTLVAMLIMKESFGWGDTQLFNESRFDIKIRYALCMNNIGNETPSIFVYNHFRRMLNEYEKATGRNLISETINKITGEGSPVFKVGENRLMIWARQVA